MIKSSCFHRNQRIYQYLRECQKFNRCNSNLNNISTVSFNITLIKHDLNSIQTAIGNSGRAKADLTVHAAWSFENISTINNFVS